MNLAGMIRAAGKKLLLVDTDPQGSLVQWRSVNPKSLIRVSHHPKPLSQRQALALVLGFAGGFGTARFLRF
jgi:cellulose biosynthesis protein BcsQ